MVNHGRGQTIEVFDVDISGKKPKLTWKNCIVAPEKTFLNSVVPLPDDGFAVTSSFDPSDAKGVEKMLTGSITGEVLEWSPKSGWATVPGGELAANNGIEVSSDGRWFYIAASGDNTFTRLSRGNKTPEKSTIQLGFVTDNIRWQEDGSLIVAGPATPMNSYMSCKENCIFGTSIVRINPKTLTYETIKTVDGMPEFHNGTVALQVNNTMYVGAHDGKHNVSRIAYFSTKNTD